MTQRDVLPIAPILSRVQQPIELLHVKAFPGAACWQIDRAAMPQSGSPPSQGYSVLPLRGISPIRRQKLPGYFY
jgi:hypothetical protein